MHPLNAGSQFAELIARHDAARVEVPLDAACLSVSAVFDPSVSIRSYLARLDAHASRAVATAAHAADRYELIGSILRTLFRIGDFRGNELAYDDPRNSLLSYVIDQRLGIPITLSIVIMEVARRTGLRLQGIGLPGHFIVRFPDESSRLYIDPFHGGKIIDYGECVTLVDRLYRGRLTWSDDFLEPLDNRAILKRVLLNLKNSLSRAKNYTAALSAIQMQLALDPDDPTELRDRGILFARLRRYDRAIEDLEAYLERSPDAGDGEHIRNTVQYLRQARNL